MSSCPICKGSDLREVFHKKLLKCASCGHGVANLDLDDLDLSKVYTSDYFNGEEYDDYINDESGIRKNFKKRLRKFFNVKRAAMSFFEIGSAHGFFGKTVQDWASEVNYSGIDVSEDAINWGKVNLGLDLHCGDYLDFKSEKVNAATHVFMWDVIEHLKYPDRYIEKLSSEVAKGTEVYISTGDFGSGLAKLRKGNWRMIHPPTHLHYFTRKSMKIMLENEGFKVEKFHYLPIWRSVKQIYYSLFMLKRSQNKFHQWIYGLIPRRLYIPINTFDIFIVKAVKK